MKEIKNESGRTMLEMLGVLGIMGILMYGAVTGINYGMTTYKINQAYNDVQEQIEGIMDLYSWSRSYTGITMANLCENDIFSRGCDSSNNAYHSLGGAISVSGTNDTFTLTYQDIGEDECARLKEMEWSTIKLNDITCSSSNNMVWEPL